MSHGSAQSLIYAFLRRHSKFASHLEFSMMFFFSSNKSFSAFFLSISMVDIIFFSLFPEICSERDHVANRKEGHVHHLVRLVCRVMVPPIRAHQFQWVPMMCTNVRLHHQALKTGITFNTQWCLFNYILILSIDPNF